METLRPNIYPKTIDISLTGKCQLDCPWCWGEEHTVGSVHEEEKWKDTLRKFKSVGTSCVVFTGGEPLLSRSLPGVLRYAKEKLSMRTTMSTNAILLDKLHLRVMPWVDDIGISLDGSNPEVNKRMRPGKINNFQKVIDGIKLVSSVYPNTLLTVRTVIARPNINDVVNIPRVLIANGIDLSRFRYKLYQVEPIGPRSDVTYTDEWRVNEDECRAIGDVIKNHNPDLSVALQLYRSTSGRYYQIQPGGNAYGTSIDSAGIPHMIDLGNPIDDFDQAIENISAKYSFISTH